MVNEKQVLTNCQRLVDPGVLIRDLTAMKTMYDAIALDGIIKALKEAPTPTEKGEMMDKFTAFIYGICFGMLIMGFIMTWACGL